MNPFTITALLAVAAQEPMPVSSGANWLTGNWHCGRGALAIEMRVEAGPDGAIVGRLDFPYDAGDESLDNWKLISEAGETILHASFGGGRLVKYTGIPSPDGELDFINLTEAQIKRIDLDKEGDELLLKLIKNDGMTQYRFAALAASVGTDR